MLTNHNLPGRGLRSLVLALILHTCLINCTLLLWPQTATGYPQLHRAEILAIQTARRGLGATLAYIDAHPEIFLTMQVSAPSALNRRQRMTAWQTWQFFLDHILYLDTMGRVCSEQYLAALGTGKSAELFHPAFAAFTTQYRFALEFIDQMEKNPDMHVLLNEAVPELGLERGSYALLKFRFLNVLRGIEFARLHVLHRYYQTKVASPFARSLDTDIAYLWQAGKGDGPALTVKNALRIVGNLGFSVWFPVQKNVSQLMGNIKVWRSGSTLISEQQIRTLAPELRPGDILLQRREWYATNIGIPGFWTHAALYIGSEPERDVFFTDPELRNWLKRQGCEDGKLDTLLRKRYPHRHRLSLGAGPDHQAPRVLEAIAEGVSFTTLEHSAAADSLAILRPNLPQKAIAQAILNAFRYSTRPYDFNFDFRTDTALVCSELIYKAYEQSDGIQGLSLPLTEVMGRPLLSPNQIARLFDDEYGRQKPQLDLVLFLDGNEQAHQAIPAGIEDFRQSWHRPKWHVFLQGDQADKR